MTDKQNTDPKEKSQNKIHEDDNQSAEEKNFRKAQRKQKNGDILWMLSKVTTLALLVAVFIFRIPSLTEPIEKALSTEGFTITLGQYELTTFQILQDIVVIVLLIWLANRIQRFLEYRLKHSKRLKASERNIISKVSQIGIFIVTFFIAMDLIGVDMGSINILSGTLGIGLGFGLQKIASNFISGLILTFEKSINEGDIIELADGTTGVVEEAGARYTQIATFDGRAIMVPNEDFITNPVINWTYENNRARGAINFAISYDSDIEKAQQIILNAAQKHPALSKEIRPACNLVSFGDNSVNLTLQFWVEDIRDGLLVPSSDIQFQVWREFREAGIQMPAPMREVYVEGDDSGRT